MADRRTARCTSTTPYATWTAPKFEWITLDILQYGHAWILYTRIFVIIFKILEFFPIRNLEYSKHEQFKQNHSLANGNSNVQTVFRIYSIRSHVNVYLSCCCVSSHTTKPCVRYLQSNQTIVLILLEWGKVAGR